MQNALQTLFDQQKTSSIAQSQEDECVLSISKVHLRYKDIQIALYISYICKIYYVCVFVIAKYERSLLLC